MGSPYFRGSGTGCPEAPLELLLPALLLVDLDFLDPISICLLAGLSTGETLLLALGAILGLAYLPELIHERTRRGRVREAAGTFLKGVPIEAYYWFDLCLASITLGAVHRSEGNALAPLFFVVAVFASFIFVGVHFFYCRATSESPSCNSSRAWDSRKRGDSTPSSISP